ncbi:TPA: hypothetical protein NG323_004559 [Vibrio parahaemolyticus]|nr:hypothetical protein [Vibrio parahaemolyticus]
MELKKLATSFYTDNPVLTQALDFDMKAQTWFTGDKIRGHGIIQIKISEELTFAIPVRSNIQHKASFILEVSKVKGVKGMGLDYSKAMLIKDVQHVSDDVFVLRSKASGKKLVGKENHITSMYLAYVKKYIAAVKASDKNILNSAEYRFTTLVNYHTELGL